MSFLKWIFHSILDASQVKWVIHIVFVFWLQSTTAALNLIFYDSWSSSYTLWLWSSSCEWMWSRWSMIKIKDNHDKQALPRFSRSYHISSRVDTSALNATCQLMLAWIQKWKLGYFIIENNFRRKINIEKIYNFFI